MSRIVDFLRNIKLIPLHKYDIEKKNEDRTVGVTFFHKALGSCEMTGGLNNGDSPAFLNSPSFQLPDLYIYQINARFQKDF